MTYNGGMQMSGTKETEAAQVTVFFLDCEGPAWHHIVQNEIFCILHRLKLE